MDDCSMTAGEPHPQRCETCETRDCLHPHDAMEVLEGLIMSDWKNRRSVPIVELQQSFTPLLELVRKFEKCRASHSSAGPVRYEQLPVLKGFRFERDGLHFIPQRGCEQIISLREHDAEVARSAIYTTLKDLGFSCPGAAYTPVCDLCGAKRQCESLRSKKGMQR